jgi:hypothetical protein
LCRGEPLVLGARLLQECLGPVVVMVFQRRLCLRHERLGLQSGIGQTQQRPDLGDALVITKRSTCPNNASVSSSLMARGALRYDGFVSRFNGK